MKKDLIKIKSAIDNAEWQILNAEYFIEDSSKNHVTHQAFVDIDGEKIRAFLLKNGEKVVNKDDTQYVFKTYTI